jgi:GAF domain-containing protein
MDETWDADVARALADFARHLSDKRTAEEILGALGDHCTDLLSVDGIGVLLLAEGSLVVGTTNSPLGSAAEHLEAELNEGPCVDCIRIQEHVRAPDLAECVDRWPTFVPRAQSAGIGGIHAVPMGGSSSGVLGTLDIVTAEPRGLSEVDLSIAEMLSDVAVSYLIAVRAHERTSQLAEQLQQALDSRVVIEQAKGILSGRHGMPLAEAFEVLRRHARSSSQRIHDVAGRVCSGDLDLT